MTIRYEVFRVLMLAAVGMSILFAVYGVASAPTRLAPRLGLRGLKRQRAVQAGDGWSQIEPFVRWLGVRVSGILSEENRNALDEQISFAGDYLGMTSDEFFALMIGSGFVGFIVGAIVGFGFHTGGATMLIIGGPIGAAIPYMHITGIAQERLKNVSRGLPYVIDLMALAMGAGLDFPGAVRQVVEKSSNPSDPIVEEFTLILQSLQLGRTRKEALLEFARRCPIDAVKEFTGSLVQAEERGNPVSEVLQIQATSSRARRSVRAEELAAKAGVAMVGPLLLVFITVMILIMGPILMKVMTSLS
jgi:tight adherence protein C